MIAYMMMLFDEKWIEWFMCNFTTTENRIDMGRKPMLKALDMGQRPMPIPPLLKRRTKRHRARPDV